MANRKESWSQLLIPLLQIAVPLVIAGGATGILTTFKESLPQNLYVVFLYVIWSVIIAMLIWLVLRLIFGDSPKKFIKWIKDRRQHQEALKILKEWHSEWHDLIRLLDSLTKNDWQPTDEQENEYRKLHIWFRRNRSRFLPAWHIFQSSRTKAAHEVPSSSASLAYKVFYENHRDPFSYFYEPLLIEELGRILRLYTNEIGEVLVKLAELLDESIEWKKLRW